MIRRLDYVEELNKYREQPLIKVITGVRRCGKSTLFQLFQDRLLSEGVSKKQIISINLEDLEYDELLDYKKLYTFLKKRIVPNKYTYFFLDEIQNCPNFEKVVDSLFIQENVDIYITGSNAYMLSGELATLLSGRYITLHMYPLSFAEYCQGHHDSTLTKTELFANYIRYGGFPYFTNIHVDEDISRNYVEGIYNTILIKDVANRAGITDINLLDNIIKCLASSVGSPISLKKISDTINSNGRKTSPNTVDNYVRALCDAFIFYNVERYDIKGRQHLKSLGKYYIVDTAIRHHLLSSGSSDIGHLIENIVYFELLRRGNKVNIGKLANKEVDFVAHNTNGMEYYQVSATVLDDNTRARELAPLEAISDHFPKVLLTLDPTHKGDNFNGIRHINLIDWLLDNK